MQPSRALGILLALVAIAFGVLGILSAVRQVRMYESWPRVKATVKEVIVHPIADNAYGNISVEFRYSNSSEKSVWAYKSFLPGRGASFARQYAAGTQHIIWLDPASSDRAEIELGWNIETLLVPLIFCVACLCLLLSAGYFLRFGKDSA